MITRSEKIEAMICEGKVSEDDIDAVVAECVPLCVKPTDEPDEVYAAGVEFGMAHAGSDVTYAMANDVLYLFLGTEEEVLKELRDVG